ncbi:uncharacterized protein CTHT_0072860 [Thermochaetoides thermophila DSM 1495]|uniref:CwfJ domain-containing protein n=1 Tax=Chaetomium thermophilum (strain DSM 1495 / CBS 144.50 / IMI 039719) TaxID=759272 RepID=G0SHP4_CHATD|nr:hypothetical protein CTHT_0072860 [Thermochaetoides thermophila DSM 1495]EGS16962.1 hypothetical protein CTHT_0072860 [Thermochaetoides thermophila DSM 1495]
MSVRDCRQFAGITSTNNLSVVFGSIDGKLRAAFEKLTAVHAKNDFSFAIITGNLFGSHHDEQELDDLLEGRIPVACPTYFTVGTVPLPQKVIDRIKKDEEIAPNLHFLGKRSVTKTLEGVRIVALTGCLNTEIIAGQSQEQHEPMYFEGDVSILRGANYADILITTEWPANICNNSAKAQELKFPPNFKSDRESIAELCEALKPRYHFAMSPVGDLFFEREPFVYPESEKPDHRRSTFTRFISMAWFGNEARAKSMYAFVLRDLGNDAQPPQGSTLCPFTKRVAVTRKREHDEGGFSRFAHDHRHHDHKRRRQHSPPPGPDKCFFCISNPNFAVHMVCAVGLDAYLAIAKGPLPGPGTFADCGLPIPAHFIIAPLNHAASISRASMAEDEASRTFAEMTRFRESLQGMVSKLSQRRLGAITWEINRARNIHVHWQFVPIPTELIAKGVVEGAFRVMANDLKLGNFVSQEFGTADDMPGDYLRIWTWAKVGDRDGEKILGNCLVLRFDSQVRFDLQYPRKVIARLLDEEDRVTWQNVVQTPEEEAADVAASQEAFFEWNFTLEHEKEKKDGAQE